MLSLEQIRAGRAMLGLKQQELAEKAGISTGTLNNIERGVQKDSKLSTLRAIQKALEAEGIVFTENNGEIGLYLKARRPDGKSVTVLVIDDNLSDRKLFRAWLSKQDEISYNIIEAGNAKEGYEAFLMHKPDCILLDFMMYGKNGFQLLMEMKKDHAVIPPILFVTAMHNEAIKKDVMEQGAYSYLDKKKLTQTSLCAAIAQAIKSRH